ncbi:MAG: MerR family transcriptional regulator [Paenibacillus macerans]|nr:MerR family transcriptional regulator [Paenibacillus macerans]KFN10781.1 merR regulatory family protein [Paenibacillus macerans]MDU7477659.1 MerR family transcriptional regulator [Paenibacillus macerans]MEC0152857.1 MerR family transcriptional regulator [Paenibacillus macerans]MEC0334015.1 MerR family transcriptional regulator [Paenibacillus macerans]UMV46178.1 MerR family transcriptional regulator [Paenibacillus macerans]
MEYTVQKLGRLAGISTRTLRYYDEIGILKPARMNSSGYRIYGQKEVDRLQQILFYRELGLSLEDIKTILSDPSFDELRALRDHREQLLDQRKRLDALIANVEKTIDAREGRIMMSNQEKFAGFKKQLIEENERKYGREIRQKYGDDKVEESNRKLLNMTEEQYEEVTRLESELKEVLAAAFKTGDPAGELAQTAADLHKRWLTYSWNEYSKEAHAGLAQMYVDDERFKAYYDEQQPGTAEFLRDAIRIYTGVRE